MPLAALHSVQRESFTLTHPARSLRTPPPPPSDTPARYFLNASTVNFGADNLLAILVDCTKPDSWW